MAEIDPQLPFVQVHRSMFQNAATLAPLLGVTYQHTLGGLLAFWAALSDRRVLAAHRREADGKNILVMENGALAERLRVAFGCAVDMAALRTLHFIEPIDETHSRVCGMSRYLDAEDARLKQSKRTAKAAQPTLPGVPPPPEKPRKLSAQEEEHSDFELMRERRCAALGVAYTPENPSPAYVNAALGKFLEAVPIESTRFAIQERFFALDWPTKREPIYSLAAFCSKHGWPTLAEEEISEYGRGRAVAPDEIERFNARKNGAADATKT